jgi:arsenite/tail-anchored protein-transporting ATPase
LARSLRKRQQAAALQGASRWTSAYTRRVPQSLTDAFATLADRAVVLFGGKGGVGKTTISSVAALFFARTRKTILFTSDPASNLDDLFSADERPPNLSLERLDAEALYAAFLKRNLEAFLELGDRGTYLDREELRRFFELSIPGMDELMAWSRIGELAEEHPDALLVVDTAPTGHTLRMLGAADHFRQLAKALDAMQAKHRDMVRQFTRRDVRDAMDQFIDQFEAQASRRRALLTDATRTAFVPVTLAEEWVLEQTVRLAAEVEQDGLHVPFVVLNQAAESCDCERCRERAAREEQAVQRLAPRKVVRARRCCTPLDSASRLGDYLDGGVTAAPPAVAPPAQSRPLRLPDEAKLIFLAGKGGVGKTSSAVSLALQLAAAQPSKHFTILSVDPAHTLRDVFATQQPPPNLAVETIDTRAKWQAFRAALGDEIERAVGAITPKGMTVAYDTEAMQKLVEIAPPGADELFAITRLADLDADEMQTRVIVDTAPTGHFLRLLDLPRTAGEWVREFMRILLHYRDLVAPGSLGAELIRASKALSALDETLHSARSAVLVVTRPERIVVAETVRLIADLRQRGATVPGVIANYLTPENDCSCDRLRRGYEAGALAVLDLPMLAVERRDAPVTALDDLRALVPIVHTPAP